MGIRPRQLGVLQTQRGEFERKCLLLFVRQGGPAIGHVLQHDADAAEEVDAVARQVNMLKAACEVTQK